MPNKHKITSRELASPMVSTRIAFLQHVSVACYAERCISCDRFRSSVRPSVRHSLVSCYKKALLRRGSARDSSAAW